MPLQLLVELLNPLYASIPVRTDRNNQILSEQRALAVKTYLVDKGIQEGNLQTLGFGETKPVTTNSTEEGRAQNRRVIFKPLDK